MSELFASYQPLVNLMLIAIGYAFSQYVVLQAGVFSVATVGVASIAAYVTALLVVRVHLHPILAVIASIAAGIVVSAMLSIPLARLRGVYQAIATLAFVQIVLGLALYAEHLTGGPMGFNGIPKEVDTAVLLVSTVVVAYLLVAIRAGSAGRAFAAIRQDEAVAATLGVNVSRYHALAFIISGAIAGLFGALDALHGYSLTPEQFGFGALVAIISYVILGGRDSVWGPIVGAIALVGLPEISRPFAENRALVFGVILMVVIAWFPRGLVDTLLVHRRDVRLKRDANKASTAS